MQNQFAISLMAHYKVNEPRKAYWDPLEVCLMEDHFDHLEFATQ